MTIKKKSAMGTKSIRVNVMREKKLQGPIHLEEALDVSAQL